MTDHTISKETQQKITVLGLYQIAGGLIGILIFVMGLINGNVKSDAAILLSAILLLLFSYSILCGVLCTRSNGKAFKFSLINQILQLVGIAMLGYAFKYVAGIYISIGLDLTDSVIININAGISEINLHLNTGAPRILFEFNLIAMACIFWIGKLMKQVNTHRPENNISKI